MMESQMISTKTKRAEYGHPRNKRDHAGATGLIAGECLSHRANIIDGAVSVTSERSQ